MDNMRYIKLVNEFRGLMLHNNENIYSKLRENRCDGIVQAFGLLCKFNFTSSNDGNYDKTVRLGVPLYEDVLPIIKNFIDNGMKPIEFDYDLQNKYDSKFNPKEYYNWVSWAMEEDPMKKKPKKLINTNEGINLLDLLGYKTGAGVTRLLKDHEGLKIYKPYKNISLQGAIKIMECVTPPKAKVRLFRDVLASLKEG